MTELFNILQGLVAAPNGGSSAASSSTPDKVSKDTHGPGPGPDPDTTAT
jgi:hypothetical protein